jgi:hypothetical protein
MAKPPTGESLTLVRCTNPFCHQVYRIAWPKRGIPVCKLCGHGGLVRATAEREDKQA